jgi:hypothetical protein
MMLNKTKLDGEYCYPEYRYAEYRNWLMPGSLTIIMLSVILLHVAAPLLPPDFT